MKYMIFPQKNVLNWLSVADFIIKTNLSNTKSAFLLSCAEKEKLFG